MSQKIKTLDIQAKEWFDKVNGNSYFSAQATINFGMKDQKTVNIPFQYGYGDSYLHKAIEQLQTGGLLPEGTIYNASQYCRDNNIILRYNKRENCLKRAVISFVSY